VLYSRNLPGTLNNLISKCGKIPPRHLYDQQKTYKMLVRFQKESWNGSCTDLARSVLKVVCKETAREFQ
jgi:hypothetical protein